MTDTTTRHAPPPEPDAPTWVSLAEWANDHSVARATAHNLVREGLLDVIKIGRATRVRRDAVPRQRRRVEAA